MLIYFLLPRFFSSSHHAFAKEFLSLLLHDLLRSQALVTILNRLLPRGCGLALITFGRLSCRSWRELVYQIKSGLTTLAYFKTTISNCTYPPFWYFYSSCHPVPCFCPHPLSRSLTSQFFGISRTP